MGSTRRRIAWSSGGVLVLLVLLLGRASAHLACVALRDRGVEPPLAANVRDDASHLEAAEVAHVIEVPPDEEAALAAVRAALAEARARKLPLSIAGARHSMGGQTLVPGGIVLDLLPHDHMVLDVAARVLRVQAGATWHQVLALLEPLGLSVPVMQSYSVFSIGGSLSVNGHGWQPAHAPLASSVRALQIVRADGELVNASRAENPELFALALGGYGLFGVILEAELELVPDEVYEGRRFVVPVAQYVATLEEQVWRDPARVGLAFGRLDVSPDDFLDEAILTVYRPAGGPPPTASDGSIARELQRLVFRGSVGSDYGKELRWRMENLFGAWVLPGRTTRDRLLDDDLFVLENHDPRGTEILQEYFVPPEGFLPFLEHLRAAVRRHGADLLNVTVRDLLADEDSFLRYADRRLLALVLYFHQERSAAADERMQPLTRELIDAALDVGGRYYLPYRLHASRAQLRAAYPMVERFFELKRRYDPEELFRNRFYDTYGSVAAGGEGR